MHLSAIQITGVYCVVFGLSIYALWQQRTAHKLYTWGSIALFTLATLYTAIYAWGTLNQTFTGFQAATTKHYSPIIQFLAGDAKKTAWLCVACRSIPHVLLITTFTFQRTDWSYFNSHEVNLTVYCRHLFSMAEPFL